MNAELQQPLAGATPVIAALPMSLGGFDANSDVSRSVLEISTDCVKVLDHGGNLLFMNKNGLCIMEIDDFDAVIGQPWPMLWPEASRATVQDSIDKALRGEVGHFIATCPTAKGTVKWWDVTVTLVPQMEGGEMRLVSISRDVSERMRAEAALEASNERLNLLTREMAHRVNNTLAVIQSIVDQTARTTPDPKAFSKAISGRIGAMAAANRSLVSGNWDGSDVERLVRQELDACTSELDARLAITGPAVGLPATAVTAFALVIHELGTNAVKYGALSKPEGRLSVSWTVETSTDGKRVLSLLWQEQGGPPVTAPTRKGFGSILLDRGIDDCKVERKFDARGVTCRITLPL